MTYEDQIVEKQLSDIEFRKWRILMRKIDTLLLERHRLQLAEFEVNRQLGKLYKQMEKLWSHNRSVAPRDWK